MKRRRIHPKAERDGAARSPRLAYVAKRVVSPGSEAGAIAVAMMVLVARLAHFYLTQFAFDDVFITARYARNLASGLGFAFNSGQPSYGFTSPMWVAIAAAGSLLRLPTQVWMSGVAVACDTLAAYFAARTVNPPWPRLVLLSLLASWPFLLSSTVSGMETSLLNLCAIAWWSRVRTLSAAAIAPLVRPEGWLLTMAHIIRERRARAAGTLIPGAVWMGIAWLIFGSPLPLSVLTKHTVYAASLSSGISTWAPHLGNLIYFGYSAPKSALVVGAISLWITALACSSGGRGWGLIIALVSFAVLIAGGAPLFEWYLAVPSFLMIVSACRAEVLSRWAMGACALAVASMFLFVWSVKEGSAQRWLLENTWGQASNMVQSHPRIKSVFGEAVGILGWRFRGDVYDETGIVTPGMRKFREAGDGWYYRAVRELHPDAMLIRPLYLYFNQPIAGAARPFASKHEVEAMLDDYVEVADFGDTTGYARLGVSIIRVLVRRDLLALDSANTSKGAFP